MRFRFPFVGESSKRTREARLSPDEEIVLDETLLNAIPRAPEDASPEALKEFLNQYVQMQGEMCLDTLDRLGIKEQDLVTGDGLEILWGSFEGSQILVRRSKKRKPRRGISEPSKLLSHRYTEASIQDLFRVGAVLGKALVLACPELRWKVSCDFVDDRSPVLSGFPGVISEMNPTQVVITMAHKHFAERNRWLLRELFEQWCPS